MLRAWRWVWGPLEESRLSLGGTLREIGIVLLAIPLIMWAVDGEPPPVSVLLWALPLGLASITAANWRWSKVEHRTEVYEARPRPGESGTPFSIASCDCGWETDHDRFEEALAAAREHSNTGEPAVVRDPV